MSCGNYSEHGAYIQWPGDPVPDHIYSAWTEGDIRAVIWVDGARTRTEYHFSRVSAARMVAGLSDDMRRNGIRYVAGRPIDADELTTARTWIRRANLLRARIEHVSQLRWLVRHGRMDVGAAAVLAQAMRRCEVGHERGNPFEETRIAFGKWLWEGGCWPSDDSNVCRPECPCGRWVKRFGKAA